jgi:hypothetical protein
MGPFQFNAAVLFGGDTWKPISGHIGGSNELHDED